MTVWGNVVLIIVGVTVVAIVITILWIVSNVVLSVSCKSKHENSAAAFLKIGKKTTIAKFIELVGYGEIYESRAKV